MIAYQLLQISVNWLTVPIGFVMLAVIIYLLVTGRRDVEAQPASSRQQERTTLTTVEEPCPDTRLHEIVEHHQTSLRKFVLVEDCEINASHFSEGKLYVDFTFSILNLFIYSVSIPMPEGAIIEGSILFNDNPLSGSAKLFGNQVSRVHPLDGGNFTIRQWVNPQEAKDISEALEKSGNLFDFSKADVYVVNEKLPNEKAAKLDLTRGMQNAELENRIIQLDALQTQHAVEIEAWQKHVAIINRLSVAYGMVQQADHIINFFQSPLPDDTLKYLDAHINNLVEQCIGPEGRDSYYKDLGFPDSDDKQSRWIRAHNEKLSVLIHKQLPPRQATAQKL